MNWKRVTPYAQSGSRVLAGIGKVIEEDEGEIYNVEADASWPEDLSDSEGTVAVFADENGIQVTGKNMIFVKDIPAERAITFVRKISIPITIEDLQDLGFERII